MTTRMGIGYDAHRFVKGHPLILGGVTIPWELGLEGHSDADVLIHAIADAILGAAGLGDIGMHFPPTEPGLEGVQSGTFLRKVVQMAESRSLAVVHIDSTIIAEQPMIGPYVLAMRHSLSELVRVPPESVSIKATTNEGMGFIGRQEGIAALAAATLRSMEDRT